jgi:hypothetical protein
MRPFALVFTVLLSPEMTAPRLFVRAAIAAHRILEGPEHRAYPARGFCLQHPHARISELLQVYGVDPLTVAAQTGTSLRMIERTYFKFSRSAMLEKLANLKARPSASM